MFSNIFSKASELSKKAKNIANQYLSSQNDPNLPPINEEKVRNMIKEIESLKEYSLQEYEKKVSEFQNQIESLKNLNNKLVVELKKVKNELSLNKKALDDLQKKPNLDGEIEELKKENSELLREINDLKTSKNENEEFSKIDHFSETVENFIRSLSNLKESEPQLDENTFKEKFSKYLKNDEFDDIDDERKVKIEAFCYNLSLEMYNCENKKSEFMPDNLKTTLEEFKRYVDEELGKLKESNLNNGRENSDMREKYLNYQKLIDELKSLNQIEKSEKDFLSKEKEELVKKIKILDDKSNDMQIELKKEQAENDEIRKRNKGFESQIEELLMKIKTMESNISESKKLEDKLNMRYETVKQSLKNIFFLYLEEDMFMDTIERCFKLTDISIDEIYRISKYIKICSTLKIYKYIINNCIKPKIKNKQFKSFKELNNINLDINSIEQLNSFSDRYMKNEEHTFLSKLFGDIIENNEIQLKAISELSDSNKKLLQQVEEMSKNDLKSQNDLKETLKTEKYLKDTVENLTNNLNFERSERENIIKSLKQSNEDLDKDTFLLKEKLMNLTQKCDVYKIENQELMEKYNIKCKELNTEKEKHESTHKEKNNLISQINEIDKLKANLNEKVEIIRNKDSEIQKLRISCQNIQNLLESYKDQHENFQSNFQENLSESTHKYSELEKLYNLQVKETENLTLKVKKLEGLNDKIALLENENKRLKDQKTYIKKQADDVMQTLKSELKDAEHYLDKRIISRFIFKYFDKNSNNNLKMAVLDALANFFGYNNEERRAIGLNPTNFQISNTNIAGEKIKLLIDVLTNFILNL